MADTAKHLPDRQRPSATFVCLVSKKPRKTMAIGRDQVPIKSSAMWSRERDRDRCGPRRSFYWGPTRSRGRHWFFQEGPTIKNQMTSSTTVQTRRKKTESTTNKTHPFFFVLSNESKWKWWRRWQVAANPTSTGSPFCLSFFLLSFFIWLNKKIKEPTRFVFGSSAASFFSQNVQNFPSFILFSYRLRLQKKMNESKKKHFFSSIFSKTHSMASVFNNVVSQQIFIPIAKKMSSWWEQTKSERIVP